MEVWTTILGGLLAGGVGWFVQNRIEAARVRRLRDLYVTGLLDDLETAQELYERLQEDWKKTHTVWFNTIDELIESRHVYSNNKDHIVLMSDRDLRHAVSRYYRRSLNHLLQLKNNQQRKYDIWAKYREKIAELRERHTPVANPLEPPPVEEQAAANMEAEQRELTSINEDLPQLVAELDKYCQDAKELHKRLSAISTG